MLRTKSLSILKNKKIALFITIFFILLFNSSVYAISLGNATVVSDSRFQLLGGITTDGTNIYVADYGAGKIWKIDASKNVTPLISISKPISVAYDSNTSKIFVITENGGYTFNTTGTSTTPNFGSGVVKASDIIVDASYIYVADISAKNVKRYNKSTGSYVDAIGGPVDMNATDAQSGKFYMPSGLAISGGKILVADYINLSEIKFTETTAGLVNCLSGPVGDIGYRVQKPTKLANKYDEKIASETSKYYFYNFCPNKTGTNSGNKPANIALCSLAELINGTCPDYGGYLGYKAIGVVPDSYEGKPKGLVQVFNGTNFEKSYVPQVYRDSTNYYIINHTLTSIWADGTYLYALDSQGLKIDIYDDISNTTYSKGTADSNYAYIPYASDNLYKSEPAGYAKYHKAGKKMLPVELQDSLVIYRDLVKKGSELVVSDSAGRIIYFPIQ